MTPLPINSRRASPWFLLAALAGLWPSQARAQASDEATRLFDEGRGAMQQGRFEQACGMLEQSFSLKASVGTLLNLAECEERRGHFEAALERWSQAEQLAKWQKDKRQDVAAQRRVALEGRIPTLTITSTMPARITLRRQGAPTATSIEPGKPRSLDPGRYDVEVTSAGPVQRYEVAVVEGERRQLAVIPPTLPSAAAAVPSPSPPPRPDPTLWWAGWGTLGGGVALAGVGAALGIMAARRQNEAEPFCFADGCEPDGVALRDEAIDFATGSTVAFAVGGVAAAAGITLLVLSSELPSGEIQARLAPTELHLEVTF